LVSTIIAFSGLAGHTYWHAPQPTQIDGSVEGMSNSPLYGTIVTAAVGHISAQAPHEFDSANLDFFLFFFCMWHYGFGWTYFETLIAFISAESAFKIHMRQKSS
jgi:hypothetical protein